MAYEQRPNNGTLFPNKSKPKPASPDYSGSILIDLSAMKVEGNMVTIRLAGWKKQGGNGTFLSLAASAPRDRVEGSGDTLAQPAQATNLADLEDDVPF
jgi:hypothetical protein